MFSGVTVSVTLRSYTSLFIFIVLLVQAHVATVASDRRTRNDDSTENMYRIVEPGLNFDLYCTTADSLDRKSTNRLEWQLPHNNNGPFWGFLEPEIIDYEIFARYTPFQLRAHLQNITPIQNRTVISEIRFENGTILSTLTIKNASYFDTGFYICFSRDSTRKIIQIREQHVFVHDHNVLVVPPTSFSKESPEVVGLISQPNLTIGCLPTHPSVNMQLFNITGFLSPSEAPPIKRIANSEDGDNRSLNGSWSFSPLKGFVFKNTVTSSLIGYYMCIATSFDPVYTMNFSVFEIKVYGVEVIPSSSEQLIPAGAPFEMTCRGRKPKQLIYERNDSGMNLNFSTPTYPLLGMPQRTDFKLTEEYFGVIYIYKIKWHSIPIEASGTYRCSDSLNATYPPWTIKLNVSFEKQALSRAFHSILNGYLSNTGFIYRDEQTLQFNAGKSFQIECGRRMRPEDFDYRRWFKPRMENDNEFYKKNGVKLLSERWSDVIATDNFRTTLTITNSSYLDTGFYFCFSTFKIDVFYEIKFIFIQGSQNLILPPALRRIRANNELRVVGPYGEEDVLIGCGPTYPDVHVFLKHRNATDHQFKVVASSLNPGDGKSIWKFSRYEGFILKAVDSWEMKGEYVCEAQSPNPAISASVTDKFEIKILGMEIVTFDNTKPIYEGDELTITCRARKEDALKLYWRWFPKGRKTNSNTNAIEIRNTTGLFEGGMGLELNLPLEEISEQECPPHLGKCKIHRLVWKRISTGATGIYECFDVSDLNIPAKRISINVAKSNRPVLGDTKTFHNVKRYEKVNLLCNESFAALPAPKVQWFLVRNSNTPPVHEEIKNDQSSKFTIKTNNSVQGITSELIIEQIDSDVEFQCVFSNFGGDAKKEFTINVAITEPQPLHGLSGEEITAIVIPIIVIVTVIIIVVRWKFVQSIRGQKRMYQELVNTRLRLLEGNKERINPDKPIEDQVECLPYDPKYEFPINRLILGKQLGIGQFGRVVQAEATGMGPSGQNKTVAVKMIKSETDNTALASLASELKILIHLGFHLNVVSLLGACTENLRKGELLVIVEFCRYGNLKDFLISNRCNFIKDSDADLDNSIAYYTQEDNGISQESPSAKMSVYHSNVIQLDNQQAIRPSLILSRPTYGRKEDILQQKSNICEMDLIKWTFQTACGMNYLSKRKVMHGDLAARNLLLADDGVVKIADFGLSRQVYQNSDYQKQGEEALPFRWMAIESLLDRVFSSKSDVWSFGITMWEIFTLSQQPYPKIIGYAGLIEFLQNGHRMEKPELASEIIGDIMANCWKRSPNERMTFDQLEKTLGQQVDERTRQRFASKDTEDSMHGYVNLSFQQGKNI